MMPFQNLKKIFNICFVFTLAAIFLPSFIFSDDHTEMEKADELVIEKIIVEGNKYVKTEVIKNRLPYKEGSTFDLSKSSSAIHNIYGIGCFRQVKLEGQKIGSERMNLYVIVEEKKLLENLEIEGNTSIRTKVIKEKLKLDKLSSIDEETMHKIEAGIIKLYKEENRHNVVIESQIKLNKDNPDKATVYFKIIEGPVSIVKRVFFVGNTKIQDRKLRNFLFTRENWILSFLDSAGTYQEDMLEMDKRRIEYFYRDHGYLMVQVPRADVEYSDDKSEIHVTFHIQEGEQFIVRQIRAPGDDIFSEDELLPLITLKEGEPYSQTKLVNSMNYLRDIWGEKGYINADVYPQVKPDESSNQVDISFHAERGKKLYVNRIIISGNIQTRDKVIRRQLDIFEGDLITTKKLNRSKTRVEYLSFFEREGVTWKIHRISDELADLGLVVEEAKTGNFNFMMSYGSEKGSEKQSLRGSITVNKSNLFGKGYDIAGKLQANRHRLQSIEASFLNPHLFDSDISGAYYFYKRWNELEGWQILDKTPIEKTLGLETNMGFALPFIDKRLQLVFSMGIEDIGNNNPQLKPIPNNPDGNPDHKLIFERSFQKGTLLWLGLDLVKDTRNHRIYPSEGYRWMVSTRTAPAEINSQFSFFKAELEASFYTALMGPDYLVLALHGKLSGVDSLTPSKIVPYKELFHMGGQATVRGFVFGSIEPALSTGDPIGARKAALFNMELIFPLIPDYSMKGHFFYDAGSGWDTPKNDIADPSSIKRDKFDLRHSVGFGINLEKPMPAKIDWGFKLDRRRKDGESPHEFHLSMNYAW